MPHPIVRVGLPAAFVLIWSTGFIVARLVSPAVEPLTFLLIRFALAAAILAGAAFVAGAPWPMGRAGWRDALVSGILLHGLYLGGVFWAVRHGLPAGVAALIAGTQPIGAALLARPLLGERVGGRRWGGIAMGLAGVALVIGPRLGEGAGYAAGPLAACAAGVAAITLGTFWHARRSARFDLRTGTAVQYLGAAAICGPLAWLTETGAIDPTPAFALGLSWAVFGLSIGAIALLLVMLRSGAVVGVSSLMFLVPPVTAMLAWAFFGETLVPVQFAGMALAAGGVALAGRAPPRARSA